METEVVDAVLSESALLDVETYEAVDIDMTEVVLELPSTG